MARKRMTAVLVAATAGLLTVGAGTALAGTATKAGDVITVAMGPGEANNLTITDDGTSTLTFDDAVFIVDGTGPDCAGSGDATCTYDANDTVVVELLDGDDRLTASTVTLPMTVNAGAGDDNDGNGIRGGTAADTLNGGPGVDRLEGAGAGDTLNGDAGSDNLLGEAGDDTLNGGDGDDVLDGAGGADVHNGGAGIDAAFFGSTAGEAITADLDGQADDGRAGEGDQVATDVEDLRGSSGDDRFTGDAGFNVLSGNNGDDVLDAGLGEDVMIGEVGNDTLFARDGFADNVDCGTGTDTAIVDTLDRVTANCETIDRADAGVARDDRPPTVSFAGPSENAFLPTASASTITALASDDKGVAEVQLIDDGRVVQTDTEAPYTFSYRPRGEDVGRNTLVLVAVDTGQQTASAVRPLRVMRFAPRALLGKVTPTRDRFAPFRYRTTGRIRLPRGVTKAQGCGKGRVSIQVKRGSKTISSRRVALGKGCGFSSRVNFGARSRVGFGSLRFVVRFLGNSILIPRSGLTLKARTS